jgi:hypothetical protein
VASAKRDPSAHGLGALVDQRQRELQRKTNSRNRSFLVRRELAPVLARQLDEAVCNRRPRTRIALLSVDMTLLPRT